MKRLYLLTSAVAALLAGSLIAVPPALARGHWDRDDDRGWAPPPPRPWRHHRHHRHHHRDYRDDYPPPPRVIYRERRIYEPAYESDSGLTIMYKGTFR